MDDSPYIRSGFVATIENMQIGGRIKAGMAFIMILAEVPWAWGSQDQGIASLTGVGPGVISQSFKFTGYFVKSVDTSELFFLSRREKSLILAKKEKEYLPLSWTLGGGYSRIHSEARGQYPEITDQLLALNAGIDWNVTSTLNMALDINFDTISAESYNHGAFLFQFWKTFSLHRKARRVSEASQSVSDDASNEAYDENLADQYYAHQMKIKERALAARIRSLASVHDEKDEDEEQRQKEHYPELKVGLIVGFANHTVSDKTYRNLALGNLSGSFNLYQNRLGMECLYLPDESWTVRFGATRYLYPSSADEFLKYLEMGIYQNLPLQAKSGWSSATNQMLSFPIWSIDQSIEYDSPNERDRFALYIMESSYSSRLQKGTLSITPSYTRELDKNWRIEVNPFLNYIFNSGLAGGGMVRIEYDLSLI